MATTAKIDSKAADMVTKAVAAIVLDDPFYGYLLLRQEIVQDPDCGTACTNGKRVKYAPEFVKTLSMSQLKGLLKHEVMHVANMHHLRRQQRDPDKWNQAADYVINAILSEANVDLPPGGLMDPQYADYSTEHVYNMLPDSPTGSGLVPNKWNWGGVEDAPGSDDPTVCEQMEADVRTDVIQAHNTAKIMGKLPAGIDRLVGDIRESRMPWKRILARFFRSTSKSDSTWMRPNRRFLSSGIYLPSLYSEALGPLVIGVDTSGSIGQELEQFFGVINSILRQTKPESVHVVYCDARVGNVQVFKPSDYPISVSKFKPAGGGGTSFEPVFEYVTEKRLKPAALLYLTDMYGSFPVQAPAYPVIWCATSKEVAPFGKTIEIK
jgi:predicted metal-dependent peptidase